jgi:hypothetical protein
LKIIRLSRCEGFTMIFFFNPFLEPASNHPLIYQRFYRKAHKTGKYVFHFPSKSIIAVTTCYDRKGRNIICRWDESW